MFNINLTKTLYVTFVIILKIPPLPIRKSLAAFPTNNLKIRVSSDFHPTQERKNRLN